MWLIFLSAIIVAMVLDRQAEEQREELEVEYRRLDVPMPAARPKIPFLEALLNIDLGAILVLFALLIFYMISKVPGFFAYRAAWDGAAAFLGAGVALAWLGARAAMRGGRAGRSQ